MIYTKLVAEYFQLIGFHLSTHCVAAVSTYGEIFCNRCNLPDRVLARDHILNLSEAFFEVVR
jgi:hypothetical protein